MKEKVAVAKPKNSAELLAREYEIGYSSYV